MPSIRTATARTWRASSAAARPGPRGVAPGVKFVNLRVLDSKGEGSTSNVLLALQWAVANRAAYGIDVINLSLGHPIYESAATDPLVQAVEAAVRAGLVVVVSAGNIGMQPRHRPGGLCRHHVARQRAVGADGRGAEDLRHRAPQRRPDGRLQLARADVVRRVRQARRRGAGPPAAVVGDDDRGALPPADDEPRPEAARQGHAAPERHQHGRRGGERHRRADARRVARCVRRQAHRQRGEGDARSTARSSWPTPTACPTTC